MLETDVYFEDNNLSTTTAGWTNWYIKKQHHWKKIKQLSLAPTQSSGGLAMPCVGGFGFLMNDGTYFGLQETELYGQYTPLNWEGSLELKYIQSIWVYYCPETAKDPQRLLVVYE